MRRKKDTKSDRERKRKKKRGRERENGIKKSISKSKKLFKSRPVWLNLLLYFLANRRIW